MAAGGAGAGAAACAACKYQRRRCTPDCPLAEYFPHDRPRVFRNAHRLFGVNNILKTLARAGPEKRREAMHCIIYESHAWDINPATGCVPIIDDLQRRICQAGLDLRRVYAAIRAYRAAAAAAQGRPVPDSDGGDPSASASSPAPPPPFQFQPAMGNNYDEATAEAYGGGGLPFLMYGGDQQQMMMNAAAPDNENIALQMPPWMMQPPQYDMASATAVADMAAGKVVPQLQQQDHRFLVDATMAHQSRNQQKPIVPIHLPAELDDKMSYFVNGMDGDSEMHHESTSMDSSEKKARQAPKMEDANGFK
ncbi:hypothetical protein SETIT_4G047700v2 [Setaria italica]|uniref:LOB domain-containing protein n=2 Tax=Setaria italica TaxID=4555 RepID=A0A368QQZ8_SETIT|nr:hypothetical protein SETIT_4G047700v2 [Setaria italica]